MLEASQSGIRIHIFVQPNGKKSEILGQHNGSLKIRVKAPPVEGKANEATEEFIAEVFNISKKRVQVLRGHLSRHKVLEIKGIELAHAKSILHQYL